MLTRLIDSSKQFKRMISQKLKAKRRRGKRVKRGLNDQTYNAY